MREKREDRCLVHLANTQGVGYQAGDIMNTVDQPNCSFCVS